MEGKVGARPNESYGTVGETLLDVPALCGGEIRFDAVSMLSPQLDA